MIAWTYPGANDDKRQTIVVEAGQPVRLTGFSLHSTLATDAICRHYFNAPRPSYVPYVYPHPSYRSNRAPGAARRDQAAPRRAATSS